MEIIATTFTWTGRNGKSNGVGLAFAGGYLKILTRWLPVETKIYYNDKLKKAYGLHENRFYEHVDGGEWVEVPSAKTPFREMSRYLFGALHDSFERFINSKRK